MVAERGIADAGAEVVEDAAVAAQVDTQSADSVTHSGARVR